MSCSPDASLGTQRACCSARARRGGAAATPSSWTARIRPVVAQARLSCSTARQTRQQLAAEPAVLLGERQRQDVLGGQQLAQVLRELAGPVDLGGPRRDALVGEDADGVTQEQLLLGQPIAWAASTSVTVGILAGLRWLSRRRLPVDMPIVGISIRLWLERS